MKKTSLFKRLLIFGIIIAVLMLATAAAFCFVITPFESSYNEGQAALKEQHFTEAAEYFSAAMEIEAKVPFLIELFAKKPESAEAMRDHADTQYQLAVELEAQKSAYHSAETLAENGDYLAAAEAFEKLGSFEDAEERAADNRAKEEGLWKDAVLKHRASISAGAWHTAVAGDKPNLYGDARFSGNDTPALADAVYSGYSGAYYLQDGHIYAVGEIYGQEEVFSGVTDAASVAASFNHALILHQDGTVTGIGSGAMKKLDIADWKDITDIAVGANHSVGLCRDGHVFAVGNDDFGQRGVERWTNVVEVAAGFHHTVALLKDGTVAATGDNQFGQCDVSEWSDIIAVSCGANFTLGLKDDYTVVAAGDNACGQIAVDGWRDIIAISGGVFHSVGLRFDGSLVYAGINSNGQCPSDAPSLFDNTRELETVISDVSDRMCEYVYDTDSPYGPWLYVSAQGAVSIFLDDTQIKKPLRADLIATAGNLPKGYVTDPEASGDIIYMPTKMTYDMARENQCVFAMTGDYIGFTRNRKAVLMRDGRVYYDRNETTTMAIQPDGTIRSYRKNEAITADALLQQGVRDSFSFGPILVQNGELQTRELALIKQATMRCAIGCASPYHYICVVTGRDSQLFSSFMQVGQMFLDYHCSDAYNLDGGHSSSMVFMGKELSMFTLTNTKHSNIRALSDIVGFLQSEQVAAQSE